MIRQSISKDRAYLLNNKTEEERQAIAKQMRHEKRIRDEIGKVMVNLGNATKIVFKD